MNKPLAHINFGVAGRFKLITHKADAEGNPIKGTSRERTGWVKNLITNRGMDALGDANTYGNFFGYACRVGSGNTAPAFTDTQLVSTIATALPFSATSGRDLAASPRYIWKRTTFRFNVGVATGNISEVGIVAAVNAGSGTGGALNPATPLSTRALVLDNLGNPTTITVLADEILDVVYEVRMNIPDADVTGTVNIAGVDYDYIIRPWRIDVGPSTNTGGWGFHPSPTSYIGTLANFRQSSGHGENAVWVGASAEITTETGAAPTGTKVDGDDAGMSGTVGAYTSGVYHRDVTQSFSLGTAGTGANNADGIGVHSFVFDTHAYQVNLTPHVPKDHTKLYSLTMRVSWSRA